MGAVAEGCRRIATLLAEAADVAEAIGFGEDAMLREAAVRYRTAADAIDLVGEARAHELLDD